MLTTTLFLCLFAFCAGLIDAAVGGGGLIQVPAMFNFLPGVEPSTLLGSNKLTSACGTTMAARSWVKRVSIPWGLVLPAAGTAFVMSFCGAMAVSAVPASLMRPLVLVLIIAMAIYTFLKKDFGAVRKPLVIGRRERLMALLIGGAIGFYDGLFGPGTGSFLIFLFIRCHALDFLQASASAKIVNLATNVAALVFFVPAGKVIYSLALPMAVFNMAGALVGSRLAIRQGAAFVRVLFLFLLIALIVKLAWDMVA
ncbi:sulfite exporter TauE/SafE family protein [Uliginosibacterium paludis]|uniref:Probable membrane transporter protein n=1 Tax=Uliginosibacterium paludis TaxID=1615952 RepID=A0ABV2CM10_9RHOO